MRALLRQHADIVETLRARGVVRTGNAPLGDYAEYLCAAAFGWALQPNSASGYDAIDQAGVRFQIKARRLKAKGNGSRQLSVIRNLPDRKFDVLAAVLFDDQFNVEKACLIPHAIVLARAGHIAHVNGWRFVADDMVWSVSGVRDVTGPLRAAQSVVI